MSEEKPTTLLAQGPVEIEGGADQAQVGESLRKIPQSLTACTALFGVEPEMVGLAEHSLKQKTCLVQTRRVGMSGSGQRLDQPERAHVESSLTPWEPVFRLTEIIAM